jgi:hypothetical protein
MYYTVVIYILPPVAYINAERSQLKEDAAQTKIRMPNLYYIALFVKENF